MPEMATAGEHRDTAVSKASSVILSLIQTPWVQLSFQKVARQRRRYLPCMKAALPLHSADLLTVRLGQEARIWEGVTLTLFPLLLWGLSSAAAGSLSILFAVWRRAGARAV